jgi:DNA-binding transcriptional regulator YhcF (GntR family)
MQTDQSVAVMKALADQSRLAIVNSLLERSQCVEEIAQRHALAPSTVSFHLKKLEQAGLVSSRKEQYYAVFRANDAMLDTTLRQIIAASSTGKEMQDGRMAAHRHRVLETFFRHGRLEKLPAQQKKRRIVLEQFALRFAPHRRYSEQEVTALIQPLFDDYCTIRRLLVDEGLIRRDRDAYWREQQTALPAEPTVDMVSHGKGAAPVSEQTRRAEIKRIYRQDIPEMGIYQIRNKVNGRIYLGSSRNLAGTRSSRLFQLRMGTVVFSRELQQDLTACGAASFEFSVLAVLEPPEPGDNIEQALAALELHWLEKLQPFGPRGYNSEAYYRRAAERVGATMPQ